MTPPKPPMVLTRDERMSPLWRKLIEHWEENLDMYRCQNDGAKTEADTAHLRGRIAEVKANLALNNERPDIPSA